MRNHDLAGGDPRQAQQLQHTHREGVQQVRHKIRTKMMLPLLQPLNVLQEYRRCHGDGRDVHHHRPGVRGRHHRGLSQEEQTPERGESLNCQVINCHSSDHLLNHSTSVTLHTLHRNKYNCVTRLIKRG